MIARIKVLPHRVNRAIFPNAITVLAILLGYLALVSIFRGHYIQAAWLILLAALFDFLDGRVARLIKATSEFGVQFDSLADVVNYGVAPALLYYFLFFDGWGIYGLILSFLPVVCSAARLARFNVQADNINRRTDIFEGLPTTMAAVLLCGYVIFVGDVTTDFGPPGVSALFIFTVAILMVSKVQYEKGNILSPRAIIKYQRFIIGSVIVLTLVLFPTIAVFTWGLLYVLSGLLTSASRNTRKAALIAARKARSQKSRIQESRARKSRL